MKKSLLSVLISLSMIMVMLSGCGKQTPPEDEPAPAVTEKVEEAAPATEPIPASVEEETAESESSAEEVDENEGRGDYISDCPFLAFDMQTSNTYDADGNWLIESYYPTVSEFSAYIDTARINGSFESLATYFEHCIADYTNEFNDQYDNDPEQFAANELSPEYPLASFTVDLYPARVDSKIVSLLECDYYFAGGAHPSTEYDCNNYFNETGEVIELENIFVDLDGFGEYAADQAKDKMVAMEEDDDYIFYDNAGDEVEKILGRPWYLDGYGIHFIFNPESIAPYACGMITFDFGYDELLSWMDLNYMPNIEDGYMAMPYDVNCQTTVINGMMVKYIANGYEGPSYLEVGNTRYTVTENGYITEAYIYKRDGKILIFTNYFSDERPDFAVFDVTDGSVTEIFSETDAMFDRSTLNMEDFKVTSPSDEAYEEIVSVPQMLGE